MAIPPPWTGPPLEHLQAIYDELKASLDTQLTELAALDTRAAVLLTPAGILLGLGVNAAGKIGPSLFALWVFNIGLLVLLASLLAGVSALRLREAAVVPTADGLWPHYATASTELMLAEECATIPVAYAKNARTRRRKRPWIIAQFVLLVLGTTLLATGYGVKAAAILK